ncbi:SagB/ThcOx family dehydrogenase [Micromonospora sp. NBC_01813]|uniref:SagB/ThcOx family dehydrogenase n=1 Tax=Micromonospora sp. NBC_01813 TaxID=2975988 RepID=UPI002DD8514E|nr:SagB/ThcOx family dehydrogenase [Micromonospora sp. NBC_01813]WSA10774.1 SagB/ThcOx family dehydrogenase [Micromonospora sp. NBC_01813]
MSSSLSRVASALSAEARTDLRTLAERHSSVARRRRLAADLLLAAVWATGTGWPDSVGWLRQFARTIEGDDAHARDRAEQSYARNQQDWHGKPARAHEVVGLADGPMARLSRLYARAWAMVRDDLDAVGVFYAFVADGLREHCGLTDADLAEVAWILSLVTASAGPRVPFFADAPSALDRQYHEQSKYFSFRGPDQAADDSTGEEYGRALLPLSGRTVPLPRPDPSGVDGPSLPEVLLRRRSRHGRYVGSFSLDALGGLLFFSAAVTGSVPLPGGQPAKLVRSHPSGGGRYPIRLLLYCHQVAGVPRGLYLYDPDRHALEELSREDLSERLLPTSMWLDPRLPPPKATGRIDAADCPLWVFSVADLTYQRLAYGLRSYRLVLVECGHLAQNLALLAAWQGRDCIGLGGYFDDAVNEVLGIDGVTSSVLYVHLMGDVDPVR